LLTTAAAQLLKQAVTEALAESGLTRRADKEGYIKCFKKLFVVCRVLLRPVRIGSPVCSSFPSSCGY
jgi:hypothetical protein